MNDKLIAGQIVRRDFYGQTGVPDDKRISAEFKVPSLMQRLQYEAKLDGTGVMHVGVGELRAQQRAAIDSFPGVPEEDRDLFRGWLAEMESCEEALAGLPADADQAMRDAAGPSRELVAHLARLEVLLRRCDPLYAQICEARELRWRLSLNLAAQALLVGWTNMVDRRDQPLAFAKRGDAVADECLMRLYPHHLTWLGRTAMELLYPSETDEKNFASPSGGSGGETSSIGKTMAVDGSSSDRPATA